MLNAIKRTVKSGIDVLSDTHLVTSLGVRMRKPYDKNGMWIGWTGEEVAEHLASVRNYSATLPLKEPKTPLKENTHKEVSGGCGRG